MAKRKSDPVEKEDEEFQDDIVEEPEKELVVPDVEFVFDSSVADIWLRLSYARLRNVFESVRFDPDGMPEDKLEFLLFMAVHSIMGDYKFRKPFREGRGVIYVPTCLSGAPVLSDFERGDEVGLYTSFHKKR
jgi:hypothetical protein